MKRFSIACALVLLAGCGDTPTQPTLDVQDLQPDFAVGEVEVGSPLIFDFEGVEDGSGAEVVGTIELTPRREYSSETCLAYFYANVDMTWTVGGQTSQYSFPDPMDVSWHYCGAGFPRLFMQQVYGTEFLMFDFWQGRDWNQVYFFTWGGNGISLNANITALYPPPPVEPSIETPSTLPDGTASEPYSLTLAAKGGSDGNGANCEWSGEDLPVGMTLNKQSGLIEWESPVAGFFTFTITVTDQPWLQTGKKTFALTIVFGDPESKEECWDGGWEEFGFKNQGQCIRFLETGKDERDQG